MPGIGGRRGRRGRWSPRADQSAPISRCLVDGPEHCTGSCGASAAVRSMFLPWSPGRVRRRLADHDGPLGSTPGGAGAAPGAPGTPLPGGRGELSIRLREPLLLFRRVRRELRLLPARPPGRRRRRPRSRGVRDDRSRRVRCSLAVVRRGRRRALRRLPGRGVERVQRPVVHPRGARCRACRRACRRPPLSGRRCRPAPGGPRLDHHLPRSPRSLRRFLTPDERNLT